MDSHVEAELDPPFEIHEPAECRGSVVFNSPHSGRVYPRAFLSSAKLDLATLRRTIRLSRCRPRSDFNELRTFIGLFRGATRRIDQ